MGLYEKLLKQKENGETPDFNQITAEQLKRLFYDEDKMDCEIANLFNITKSKVGYKRRKYGINFQNKVLMDLLDNRDEYTEVLNEKARQRVMKKESIDLLAKAITHFAFRNGPVEDMHANGQLSQGDMKTLNKFMVNRLAYVFQLIIENRWQEFEVLVRFESMYGNSWDPAVPDGGGLREILLMELYRNKPKKNQQSTF